MSLQSPNEVIMVRPGAFGFDEETAETNAFQQKPRDFDTDTTTQTTALDEFDNAVR